MEPRNSADNKKNKVLADDYKLYREGNNPLARLAREMLAALKVRPQIWNMLVKKYMDDPVNGVPNTPKDRSTKRGNIDKAVFVTKLTWLSFELVIRVLSSLLSSVRIEIHVTTKKGEKFVVGEDLYRERPRDTERDT